MSMRMNRFLVVDDNVSHLQLLSIFLETEGFEVTTSASAINALEILKKTEFDTIITDFNMPGMNGIKLAMKVRKHYPDSRVIMITGTFSPEIIEAAANAGVSDILFKPIKLKDLLAITRSSSRLN